MSKIEKRLEKWANPSFKQDVPVDDLFSVLNKFFPERYNYGDQRGSHIIKVWHEDLIDHEGFGPEGDFTIPTTGGKHVKHRYLKFIVSAVNLIREGNCD